MAYYQDGELVREPGDEGYSGAEAPARKEEEYCFDGEHWVSGDDWVEHPFGWDAGVLRTFGGEDAARYIDSLAGKYGLELKVRTARSLLGGSHVRFLVSGRASTVAAFLAEVAEVMPEH